MARHTCSLNPLAWAASDTRISSPTRRSTSSCWRRSNPSETFGLIENVAIDVKISNGEQWACRADRVAQLDESLGRMWRRSTNATASPQQFQTTRVKNLQTLDQSRRPSSRDAVLDSEEITDCHVNRDGYVSEMYGCADRESSVPPRHVQPHLSRTLNRSRRRWVGDCRVLCDRRPSRGSAGCRRGCAWRGAGHGRSRGGRGTTLKISSRIRRSIAAQHPSAFRHRSASPPKRPRQAPGRVARYRPRPTRPQRARWPL
jgi:hypothetical protein